tara:strand:+ start:36 stop:230 length:195 start_codon:yes stop_codon:yes gene_type:complete
MRFGRCNEVDGEPWCRKGFEFTLPVTMKGIGIVHEPMMKVGVVDWEESPDWVGELRQNGILANG